jgi:hypothetical protein
VPRCRLVRGPDGRIEQSFQAKGNWQFVGEEYTNSSGQLQRNIARFDVSNLRPGEVPHLNLEVQINGVPKPELDPHIPIDTSTLRPGDY